MMRVGVNVPSPITLRSPHVEREVPLEHREDATALMLTLIHSDWRHLPHYQRARVGQRMARYVADRIAGEPFVPFVPIGT